MTIKIDVIIPSYNRAATVGRAIQSVLNQSYQHYNLYLVDDGSSDETDKMIHPYLKHEKFHYLRQGNSGVSAARNLGIKSSASEWIAFLDSDDEWLPHKLESQVSFIKENPDHHFVHSNEIWIRNGVRVNPKVKFDKSNHDIFRRSLEMCLISPSTTLLHRDLITKFGLFDETFEICEDYDLWLKILAHEKIGFVTDNLVKKYGGHADQLSTKYHAMDLWRMKSMVNLLESYQLEESKTALIHAEIEKKAALMLAGLIKHKQLDQHQKLLDMLNHIKPKMS